PQRASSNNFARTSMAVIELTKDNFESTINGNDVVVVDFWAPWCGPCRMTDPIVQKLAGELAGRVRVAKVNVDENPGISMRYGIQSIPTMMVVRNGQIVDRWAGALPEPALRSRIAPLLRV
ncbi:MAG TPA: thioredoxin, partial [Anaerolineales bacterium]